MSVTTAPSFALTTSLAPLEFSRRVFLRLLENFPADKLTFQPAPGANHVMWEIGHMATTDDFFRVTLTGGEPMCPESWGELFGMGSTPHAEYSAYPSFDELREAMDRTRAATLEMFQAMSDDELAKPLPENLRTFAPTFAALPGSLGVHEGVHAGQIMVIRKALGLERVMG